METSEKNKKRVANRVKNQIDFSDGTTRRPDYAILMPNGHKVLCRTGSSLGASALISRKEAERKKISYLKPIKHELSGLFLYSNKEVRDSKGKYIGKYIGYEGDNFPNYFCFNIVPIFVLKDEKIFKVGSESEMEQVSTDYMVSSRLNTRNMADNIESYMAIARKLAEEKKVVLRAALALQEYREYDLPTEEELERARKAEWKMRCDKAARDYILETEEGCPLADHCEAVEKKLRGMSEEQLTRFENRQMSVGELLSFPDVEEEQEPEEMPAAE